MSHSTNEPTTQDAAFAQRMLGSDVPEVDARGAYDGVLARGRTARTGWIPALAGFAVAAALVIGLLFTPLGSYAGQLLTIFEPHSVAPIAITGQDREQLRLVPQLTDFGTLHVPESKPHGVSTLAAAEAMTGLDARTIAKPHGTSARVRYYVILPATVSFTFSAAKASAYEQRYRRHLPPMPAGLDGTTIRVTIGPALATAYGNVPKNLHGVRRDGLDDALVFVQAKSPRITSTGSSMETLERYLLALPNVPPDVAAQLRAIADPSATLPVPFAIDKTTATPVDVDGARGLAIGDETGLGSGVYWQKNATIYVIAGSMKESDLLALANGLK